MLLDSGYFQASSGHRQQRAAAGSALHALPAMPSAAGSPDLSDDTNPFHVVYPRGGHDVADGHHDGTEADDGGLSDAMNAMEAPLLEMDAALDSKSMFVDAFQYWRQDGDADCGFSSTPDLVAVKTEPVPGGLPHMIPGSARFAGPESILLHTGANVVDLVSGVTCSGVGLGALGRDAVGDFAARAPYRALGNQQGNFGHLLRQRPASVGGEVGHQPAASLNQVVVRQRPHSEDLQGLSVFHGPEDADDDLEDDEYDDDVFLAGDVHAVDVPGARRQRLSSSGNSFEDGSDEDDGREEGADGPDGAVECRWAECGLQFPGRAPLVRHIEKVHVEPRRGEDFSCLWRCCPRGARPFNARYKLLIHMRVHSGEKPNKCPFPGCPKAFSRLENLKIHQRSHTGERPYCCQFAGCSKAFSNSSDRAKHQRTHFDTKPYACQVPGCTKRYTDPSSLRKHVKNHSGKDLAHAQVRRAGSTGSTGSAADSEASLGSESSQFSHTTSDEGRGYKEHYGDVTLDDAIMFPSADDIDQAIREFIPFEEVDKYITEPNGVSGFDLHEPLEFDFDPNFWNCPA